MNSPIDRVSGRSSPHLSGWSGRWYFQGKHLLDSGQSDGTSRDHIEADSLASIDALGKDVGIALVTGTWRSFLSLSLLDRISDDAANPGSDELVLEKHISSLEVICNKEYLTRIGEVSEVIPVGRVRRPARRALDRLASHTEDWYGRSLKGPIPRRAMAILRDEDANLYENRMVTELVHPILTSALMRRLRHLRKMQANLAELVHRQEGSRARNERLYEFWGLDEGRARQSSDQVVHTVQLLDSLLRQVQKLRGSRLSGLIGGRTSGSRTLRKTNVIQDHRHYRAAGLVWQAFQQGPVSTESSEARSLHLQKRHDVYDGYVLAFLVQALEGLGYRPSDELTRIFEAGTGETALLGPWGECSLHRDAIGVVTLSSRGIQTRFVPLLDLIAENDSPELVESRWASVVQAAAGPTVIVYLGSPDLLKYLPLNLAATLSSAGKDLNTSPRDVQAIPISPWEIASLERVSRAVRIAIQTPVLQAYPPPIQSDSSRIPRRLFESLEAADIRQQGYGALFHKSSVDDLGLRRPFSESERSRLDGFLENLDKASHTMGWERDYKEHIPVLRDAILKAADRAEELLTCPACGHKAGPREVTREDNVFLISCSISSCKTRWGHEKCGLCSGRICIIESEDKILNPEVSGPGWVERILGRDALASPCWARVAPLRYICTECRECNGARDEIAASCVRCQADK